jgi:hypothetical protein
VEEGRGVGKGECHPAIVRRPSQAGRNGR